MFRIFDKHLAIQGVLYILFLHACTIVSPMEIFPLLKGIFFSAATSTLGTQCFSDLSVHSEPSQIILYMYYFLVSQPINTT